MPTRPTPTAIKVLNGNPGKRRLNAMEPQPRRVTPKAPRHLNDAARKEWRRLVRILQPMGVLTEAEADLLAVYAQTYAQWVQASRQLQEQSLIIFSGNGTAMRNPLLKVVDDAIKVMGRCMSELGMTPAARVRLVAPQEENDEMAAFLDGR